MKNARLIIAIISSLLDEALIIGLLLWGLPKLGLNLSTPIIVIIAILFALFAVTSFTIGTRVLRMKPLAGLTDMVGVEGRVVKRLTPLGLIKINSEIWDAKSLEGIIEKGTEVIVISQKRLKLEVKRKHSEDAIGKPA